MKLAILGMMLCCFSMSNSGCGCIFGRHATNGLPSNKGFDDQVGNLKQYELSLGNQGALNKTAIDFVEAKKVKITEALKQREILLLEISTLGASIERDKRKLQAYTAVKSQDEPVDGRISELKGMINKAEAEKGVKTSECNKKAAEINQLIREVNNRLEEENKNNKKNISKKNEIKKELEAKKRESDRLLTQLENARSNRDTIEEELRQQNITSLEESISKKQAELNRITAEFANNHEAWLESGLGISVAPEVKSGVTILAKIREWLTSVSRGTRTKVVETVSNIKAEVEKRLDAIKTAKYDLDEAKKKAELAKELARKAREEADKKIKLAQEKADKVKEEADKNAKSQQEVADKAAQSQQELANKAAEDIRVKENQLNNRKAELESYVNNIENKYQDKETKEVIEIILPAEAKAILSTGVNVRSEDSVVSQSSGVATLVGTNEEEQREEPVAEGTEATDAAEATDVAESTVATETEIVEG